MLGLGSVRRIAGEVRRDVRAAYERDPAATNVSATEILASWPGVDALLSHRVAHALDDAGVPVAPRLLSYVARSLTGIEIHPAAKISDGLFIDHGMGVGSGAKLLGHPLRVEGRKPEGPDADWVHLPDPIADALKQLSRRIKELESELAELRGEEADDEAEVVPLRPVRGPNPAGG